ncbi:hypothetical protein HY635_02410 [Candidatus Uhrbacteria bacterium]|nr:hypothetical protein [Candidatus Uhrbacteria bacterium]
MVIALPPQVPDLAIADLALTADQATWKLRNVGDPIPPTRALTFVVELQWLDQAGTPVGPPAGIVSDIRFPTPTYVHARSSGYSGSASSDYILRRPAGAAKLRVTEDSANVIQEKDETNNVAEVVLPLPPQSDLAFTNVFLVPPSRERLVIGFENRGKAAAPEFPWTMAWVDAAGKRLGTPYEGIGLALKPNWRFGTSNDSSDPKGKPMSIGKWLAQPKPDGAVQLEIIIDPENRIEESDEKNNRRTFDEWSPPKAETSTLSDLTLRDAKLSRENLKVTIVNVGKGTADRVMWQFRWLGGDGAALATSELEAAVGTLKPGASYPVELPIANARAFGIFRFLQDMPAGAAALEITVDPKNAIPESDERNNAARVELVGPDLALGSVEAQDGALRIEVKNIGTKASVATDIWLMWFGAKGSLPSSGGVGLPAITAGGTVTVSVPLDGKTEASQILREPPKDGTRLRIFLDGSRKVEELNEQNNDRMVEREKLPTPTAPTATKLPDLVVRDLVITPERPIWNTVVSFTARVENIGEASVGRSTATWLNLVRPRDGSMAIPMAQQPTTPDLAPGASAVARWEGEKFWTIQNGENEVIICAESMGYVRESNEQNNCARKKFTVAFPVPAKPSKPDLIVERISVTPAKSSEGDALTFSAVIRNAGSAAGESVAYFSLDLGNDDDPEGAPEPEDVPAIAAGATKTVTWQGEAAVAGTHKIEVCADVGEDVEEANEENNCREQTFTVGGAAAAPSVRSVASPFRSLLGAILSGLATPIVAGEAPF